MFYSKICMQFGAKRRLFRRKKTVLANQLGDTHSKILLSWATLLRQVFESLELEHNRYSFLVYAFRQPCLSQSHFQDEN